MNYYPHHIGDFNSATRHLSRVERSVYRDLIELYYDTELPLIADVARLCRLVIAASDEERTAVEQVLNEFFTKDGECWSHARCEREICKYHGNKEAKSAAGKASAAARAKKNSGVPAPLQAPETVQTSTAVEQPFNECATNQELELELEPVDLEHAAAVASTTPGEPDAKPKPVQQKTKRGARLAVDWVLPSEWLSWALTERPEFGTPAVMLEGAKFADFWKAKAGKDATKLDWQATWRNWFRNARQTGTVHPFPAQSRHSGFDKRDYTAGLIAREDGTYAF